MTKYRPVTFKSSVFKISEDERTIDKCGWLGCPWPIYDAKSIMCSRLHVIAYEDEHNCAPNIDDHLVAAKVITKRYEHHIIQPHL